MDDTGFSDRTICARVNTPLVWQSSASTGPHMPRSGWKILVTLNRLLCLFLLVFSPDQLDGEQVTREDHLEAILHLKGYFLEDTRCWS